MAVQFNLKTGACKSQSFCPDKFGCVDGVCPDFVIRRHDTKPPLRVKVEDCDGPMSLQGLVVEVNMWALAKLKIAITTTDDYFRLADDVGFEQVMVGDIIVMDRARMPERMLVTAFDETNKLVKVQRGYHGTTPSAWKKGSVLRIFRVLNATGESELVFGDVTGVDGVTETDVLQEAHLVYEWQVEDTCLPGCYWLEFKLLKMIDLVWYLPGGNWVGEVHKHTDGFFYTGTLHTDSSVKLSFDQVADKYFLSDIPWPGATHLHSGSSFTGSVHDDGSVLLDQTGVPSSDDVSYNEDGVTSLAVSIIPSFTDESLTPADFGCVLGEGVEWVRRFPISGEGFLIKIEDSYTPETG
jgi:hypothetical protein